MSLCGGSGRTDSKYKRPGRLLADWLQTEAEPIGSISAFRDDCECAELSCNLPGSGLSSAMAIRRIVPDNVPLCEALFAED